MAWMAALKLACRGRTMADTCGYQAELHALRSLLRLHHNCPSSPAASMSLSSAAAAEAGDADRSAVGVRVQDLVAARHCNRLRHKQVRRGAHILETSGLILSHSRSVGRGRAGCQVCTAILKRPGHSSGCKR